MLHIDSSIQLTAAYAEAPNLTGRFSEDDLARIGQYCWEGYERDEQSRAKWLKRTQAAMDLALQVSQGKSTPWENCSNVAFPLITIATLQFHSRAYPRMFESSEIVKYRVPGLDPSGELTAQANLVARYMSHQCLNLDESFEEQHDRLLINVPIVGCAFIKTRRNTARGINTSSLVLAQDLVIDYHAKSVDEAHRKTHLFPLYRNEIHERCVAGTFHDVRKEAWYAQPFTMPERVADVALAQTRGATAPQPNEGTPILVGEQHCWLDLDKDGYAEPYIVTFDIVHKKVLRIVARWDTPEDVQRVRGNILRIRATEHFTKFGLIPDPGGSIYDIGFGPLLGPLNESVNTIINQLIDAGTMQVMAGGFISRGVKMRSGQFTFSPFGWNRVDSTGDDLRKGVFPLPVREPSNVLFQLLTLLINYVQRVSGSTDVLVGENPGQNTAKANMETMVEQGLKIYNATFKRLWRSLRDEYRKLYVMNGLYMSGKEPFGEGYVTPEMFRQDPSNVIPAADPSHVSESAHLQQAITLKQAAATTPGYDPVAVERNFLRALRVDGVEKMFPGPDKMPPPQDPKAAVDAQKLELERMRLENEREQFLLELQEQQRLNDAKIVQLEAQAAKLLAESDAVGGSQQLEAVKTMIAAYQASNDALTKRVEMLQPKGPSNASKQGGGEGMATPPSDESLQRALDLDQGILEGVVGTGQPPGGNGV